MYCLRKHLRRKRILVMYYSVDHHFFSCSGYCQKNTNYGNHWQSTGYQQKHWDCTAVHAWNESLLIRGLLSLIEHQCCCFLTGYACKQSHSVWDFYHYTLGTPTLILILQEVFWATGRLSWDNIDLPASTLSIYEFAMWAVVSLETTASPKAWLCQS